MYCCTKSSSCRNTNNNSNNFRSESWIVGGLNDGGTSHFSSYVSRWVNFVCLFLLFIYFLFPPTLLPSATSVDSLFTFLVPSSNFHFLLETWDYLTDVRLSSRHFFSCSSTPSGPKWHHLTFPLAFPHSFLCSVLFFSSWLPQRSMSFLKWRHETPANGTGFEEIIR